jgi:hypothetical protein
MNKTSGTAWRSADGGSVACTEKLKVLEQNLDEFRAMALDLLEDAALMGCDVGHVREVLKQAIDEVDVRYHKAR